MWTRQTWIVFQKEMRDSFRDRRSFLSALAYALFGPLVLVGIVLVLVRQQNADVDRELTVIHEERAPGLVEYLEAEGFSRSDDALIRLRVETDEAEALSRGREIRLTLRADLTESGDSVRELRSAISRYERERVTAALVGRGIASRVVRPVRLELEDLSRTTVRGKALLSMLLIFFTLAPFIPTMAAATDSTAGERERSTLEPLLLRPLSPGALSVGKWLALVVLGCVGVVLTVGIGMLALVRAPLGELGLHLQYDVVSFAGIVVALLPLVCSVGALQLMIGLWAKSYKEGQTYLNMLSLVPVSAAVFATYDAFAYATWIPVIGDAKGIESILLGSAAPDLTGLLAVHITMAAVCIAFSRARFQTGGGILGT